MYGGVRVIIVRLFIDPPNSNNMLPVQSVAKTMAVGSRSVWRLHDSMFVKLKINICSLYRKPVGQSTGHTLFMVASFLSSTFTPSLPQCSCWSPDGSVLLFATIDEQTIYSLTFSKAFHDQPGSSIGGSRVAVASVDVSSVEVEGEDGPVRVGGAVQAMVWDPTGSRLAVLFKNSDLIALFQTRLEPMLEIIPW